MGKRQTINVGEPLWATVLLRRHRSPGAGPIMLAARTRRQLVGAAALYGAVCDVREFRKVRVVLAAHARGLKGRGA